VSVTAAQRARRASALAQGLGRLRCAHRAGGGSAPIAETPAQVVREIPAFWVYYLRAVFG